MGSGNNPSYEGALLKVLNEPSSNPEEQKIKDEIINNISKLKDVKQKDYSDFMYGFSTAVNEGIQEVNVMKGSGIKYSPKKLKNALKEIFGSIELKGGSSETFYLDNIPEGWRPGRVEGNRQFFTSPDGKKTVLVRPRPPPPPPPQKNSPLDQFMMVADLVIGMIPGVNILWSIGKMIGKAVRGEPVTLWDGLDLVFSVIGSLPLIGQAVKGLTSLSSAVKVINKVKTTGVYLKRLIVGLPKFGPALKPVPPGLMARAFSFLVKAGTKAVYAWSYLPTQATNKLVKVLKINPNTYKGAVQAGFIANVAGSIQTNILKMTYNEITKKNPSAEKLEIEAPPLTQDQKDLLEALEIVDSNKQAGYLSGEAYNLRVAHYFFILVNGHDPDEDVNIEETLKLAIEYADAEAQSGEEAFALTKDDAINPNQLASASRQFIPMKTVKNKENESGYTIHSRLERAYKESEYINAFKPFVIKEGGLSFRKQQQDALLDYLNKSNEPRKYFSKLLDDAGIIGFGHFNKEQFIDIIITTIANYCKRLDSHLAGNDFWNPATGEEFFLFIDYNVLMRDSMEEAESGMSKYTFDYDHQIRDVRNTYTTALSQISNKFNTATLGILDLQREFIQIKNPDGTIKETLEVSIQDYTHAQLVLLQSFKTLLNPNDILNINDLFRVLNTRLETYIPRNEEYRRKILIEFGKSKGPDLERLCIEQLGSYNTDLNARQEKKADFDFLKNIFSEGCGIASADEMNKQFIQYVNYYYNTADAFLTDYVSILYRAFQETYREATMLVPSVYFRTDTDQWAIVNEYIVTVLFPRLLKSSEENLNRVRQEHIKKADEDRKKADEERKKAEQIKADEMATQKANEQKTLLEQKRIEEAKKVISPEEQKRREAMVKYNNDKIKASKAKDKAINDANRQQLLDLQKTNEITNSTVVPKPNSINTVLEMAKKVDEANKAKASQQQKFITDELAKVKKPIIQPQPIPDVKTEKEKIIEQLKKAGETVTKADEMRIGLDLLNQFKSQKKRLIPRRRIRLYNPTI